MTSPALKPVFLDHESVGLSDDPKPRVAAVAAATGKKLENAQYRLLQSEKDTQGKTVAADYVLDRTVEPSKPIYLLSMQAAGMNKGASGAPAAGQALQSASPASKATATTAPVLDVEKALKELATTSIAEIEHSTALTWGARAVASFQMCAQATEWTTRFQNFCDGENYRQEALEHAAMGTGWQQLMPVLDAEINKARSNAETAMQVARPLPSATKR